MLKVRFTFFCPFVEPNTGPSVNKQDKVSPNNSILILTPSPLLEFYVKSMGFYPYGEVLTVLHEKMPVEKIFPATPGGTTRLRAEKNVEWHAV